MLPNRKENPEAAEICKRFVLCALHVSAFKSVQCYYLKIINGNFKMFVLLTAPQYGPEDGEFASGPS